VTLATADGRPSSSTVSRPLLSTATIATVALPLHHNIIRWICVVDLSDCATVPVWPSQPARCFVLGDVREHATCNKGASGNSDDITISSWTLSRYHDPKKVHDLSPKANNTEYSKQDTKDMI